MSKVAGATAAQVQFNIQIKSAEKLGKTTGKLRVAWKKSKTEGKTKPVSAVSDSATWDENVTFVSKMFKDKGSLSAKRIVFILREKAEKDGKSKDLGKASVDLASYVNMTPGPQTTTLDLNMKSGKPPILKIIISAEILKLKASEDKKLTPGKGGEWQEGVDSEWETSESESEPPKTKSKRSSLSLGRSESDKSGDDKKEAKEAAPSTSSKRSFSKRLSGAFTSKEDLSALQGELKKTEAQSAADAAKSSPNKKGASEEKGLEESEAKARRIAMEKMELEAKLLDKDSQIFNLKNELKSAQSVDAGATEDLKKAKSDLKKTKSEIKEKEEEIKNLKAQATSQAKRGEEELKKKDQELKKRDEELKKRDEELKKRDEELKKRDDEINKKDSELRKKDSEINSKEQSLQEKEKLLLSKQQEYQSEEKARTAQIQSLEKQLQTKARASSSEDLKAKQDIDAKIIKLEVENTAQKADISRLKDQLNSKTHLDEIQSLKQQLNALQLENQKLGSKITELNQAVTNEKAKAQTFEREKGSLQRESDSAYRDLATKQSNLQTQNQKLESEIQALQSQLQSKDKRCDALSAEKGELLQKLHQLETRPNTVEEKITPRLVGNKDEDQKFLLTKATSQGTLGPLSMEGGGTMEQKMERAIAARREMEVELEMVKFQLINAKLSRANLASDELAVVKKQLQQMLQEKGIKIDLSGLTQRKDSQHEGDSKSPSPELSALKKNLESANNRITQIIAEKEKIETANQILSHQIAQLQSENREISLKTDKYQNESKSNDEGLKKANQALQVIASESQREKLETELTTITHQLEATKNELNRTKIQLAEHEASKRDLTIDSNAIKLELKQFKSEFDDLKISNQKLLDQLNWSQQAAEAAQQEGRKLKMEKSDLERSQKQLVESQKTISGLSKSLSETKAELECANLVEQVHREKNVTQKSVTDVKKENESFMEKLTLKTKQCDDLQRELSKAHQRVDESIKEAHTLITEKQSLQLKYEQSQSELNGTKNVLANMTVALQESGKGASVAELRHHELTEQLKNTQSSLGSVIEQLNKANQEKQTFLGENRKLENDFEELKKKLEQITQENNNTRSQKDVLDSVNSDLETRLQKLTQELEFTKTALSKSTGEADNVSHVKFKLESELQDSRDSVQRLLGQVDSLEREKFKLENDVASNENVVKGLNENLARSRQENQTISIQLHEVQQELDQLKASRERQKQEMDAIEQELSIKLDTAQIELKKSSKKINKLKFEKEELEIAIDKLNEDAKSQKGDVADMKKLKDMESELESAHTTLSLYSLFEDTIYFMSEANYTTSDVGGVDKRTLKLLKPIMNPPGSSDFYQILLDRIKRCFSSSRSTTDLIYWLKQIAHLFISLCSRTDQKAQLDAFLKKGLKLPHKKQKWNNDLARFTDDLLKLVGKIYGRLIDVVSEKLFPLIQKVIFNPLENDALLDQRDAPSFVSATETKASKQCSHLDITVLFNKLLEHMEEFDIPASLVIQFFDQMLTSIDVKMFNRLLKHVSMYCVAERAFHIKLVLSHIDDWKVHALGYIALLFQKRGFLLGQMRLAVSPHVADLNRDTRDIGQFTYLAQAANLMVLSDKKMFADPEFARSLCPSLSDSHLYFLLSNFQPSMLCQNPVSSAVLRKVKSWGDINVTLKSLSILEI